MNQTQLISQKLTCLFETGEPKLSVASVENLDDGRGYTCGWAGFTTADEEVVRCVEEYSRLVPTNNLEPMLEELRHLQDEGSDDVSKLDEMNFPTHWKNAASTQEFQHAYASVVERIFGQPAQEHIDDLGLKLPVAYAILFDSVIQHGNDDDPDGLPALIEQTISNAGKPSEDNEKVWLLAFLEVRENTLKHPHNHDTAAEWRESVSRVEALVNIVNDNPGLEIPVQVTSSEHDEEIS
ncbi:chitosanase [Abditibacteriota bacterium]|nr:chitosanase [Abditibacteriota bacterium]